MGSNSFGNLFKITTWGESHGKAIGVVIDGCPAGVVVEESCINSALARRAPGNNPLTSPRKEPDQAEILSGVFEGKTTGTPISIIIWNKDADSSKYEPIKDKLRPGHANYTYLEKYGVFDYRGGGRSSARETVGRVAAGAIAAKILRHFEIEVSAQLHQEERFIEKAKVEGDSVGGVVEFTITNAPVGLGDPIYQKLEANLAKAMMSLPATKGFELGLGFKSAKMKGSEHNDLFVEEGGDIKTSTNHAGGTLGGISTGMPITGKVAFKPTSSILKTQKTLTTAGKETTFSLPPGSRHDPCVAIRAVPIVEAMCSLVLVDALLLQRCTRL